MQHFDNNPSTIGEGMIVKSVHVKEMELMGWVEWVKVFADMMHKSLFQKLYTHHLPQQIPLPSDIASQTCIVTGSTSGIGLQIAKQLAEAGAHVILACRNVDAAQSLVREWRKNHGSTLHAEVMKLDLLSLASVRAFAASWEARQAPLHILINNAGILSMLAPQRFSEDGYEEHMQVNHLAPALLTLLLLPSLLRSTPSARVVNVNSEMECFGTVDPDDLNFTSGKRSYSTMAAYSGSKLAQIYFSSVLERKLPKHHDVHVMCVHPGVVATNVTRTLPRLLQPLHRFTSCIYSFTPVEGARSVLFCATAAQALEHAKELRSENTWPLCPLFSPNCKPTLNLKRAKETNLACKVWERTLELIGIPANYLEKLILNDIHASEPTSEAHIKHTMLLTKSI